MTRLADIVFIVDESGSMHDYHAWLGEMIDELDSELIANDIDPQYGIVGFGTTMTTPVHKVSTDIHEINWGHKHYIGGVDATDSVGGSEWATSANIIELVAHFDSTGVGDQFITDDLIGSADLYEAVEYTVNRAGYTWRTGATKAFICVSDTCRETQSSAGPTIPETGTNISPWTYSETLDLLRNNNILTAWVVNQELRDVGSSQILGANFDLVSYIPDGDGGYTTGTWDFSLLDNGRRTGVVDSRCWLLADDYLDVKPAYVDLATAANGSVWDLDYLNAGTLDFVDNAASFSAAFVTLFAEEINTWACQSSDIPVIPFYCPSTELAVNSVIKFTQTNEAEYYDEYGVPQGPDLNLQFRVTFYSDVNRSRVVYSSFSLIDNKRWYISGTSYGALDDGGATIGPGEAVDIIYVPEVYPQELFEKQSLISTEVPLLSGVQYYVEIENYNIGTSTLSSISTVQFKVDASDVETNFWREDLDKNNWICSSQGQSDLLVSDSGSQALFPSIAANRFGLFYIAYQSFRDGATTISRATWDVEIDKIYGSGQGLWETEGPFYGQKPKVITDQGQSFYIYSNDDSNFYTSNCSLPSIDQVFADPSTGEVDAVLCYPGLTSSISQEISVRIREEDTTGSFVINRDDVASVIEKTDINIDISGVYGAYAVRVRNQGGIWSGWTGVNNSDFIDGNRLIIPWTIPRINGLRHLCCQVLTIYGLTEIKCVDIFVNMQTVDYFVEYFYDEAMDSPVSSNEGFYLLATRGSPSVDIYAKVTFSESQTYSTLKFDVVHQGISNIFNYDLLPVGVSPYTSYKGKFAIRKEDGVYDKDGKGLLKVKFPDDNSIDNCESDTRDPYNQMLITSELEFLEIQSQSPEEAFIDAITKDVNKVIDINNFKQYYDNDDSNFLFGDPGFYKD